MAPAERLTGGERREEILAASLELFARHGLHGVTTRMIADAARVSEALLYRHFKGKEELFEELQRWCLRGTMGAAEKLAQLEPGTSTLVLAIYFTVRAMIGPGEKPTPGTTCIKRIMLHSLIGDGEFARGFVKANFTRFLPALVACMEAAWRAGDLEDRPRKPEVRIWFMHHLAAMASNMLLPERPVVDHGLRGDALIEEITRFSLRGLGLTEVAMARHFVPKTLAVFTNRLMEENK